MPLISSTVQDTLLMLECGIPGIQIGGTVIVNLIMTNVISPNGCQEQITLDCC